MATLLCSYRNFLSASLEWWCTRHKLRCRCLCWQVDHTMLNHGHWGCKTHTSESINHPWLFSDCHTSRIENELIFPGVANTQAADITVKHSKPKWDFFTIDSGVNEWNLEYPSSIANGTVQGLCFLNVSCASHLHYSCEPLKYDLKKPPMIRTRLIILSF